MGGEWLVVGSRAIDRWLAAYEAAWASGNGVTDLFTPHARYFTAPYKPPLVGADAIETWWIAQGESDDRWTFEREVIAVDGSLHVVQGTTTYPDSLGPDGKAQVYYNLWLITLVDDGRASEFVEYWMLPE
jgi:hypothetical protein